MHVPVVLEVWVGPSSCEREGLVVERWRTERWEMWMRVRQDHGTLGPLSWVPMISSGSLAYSWGPQQHLPAKPAAAENYHNH